jgi:hypothetical protein
VLTASGSDVLKWYGSPSGGPVLSTGNSFTTPALSTGTTYYVANTWSNTPVIGGMMSNTGGGNLANSQQWLIFNVVQQCTLNSVVVYAGATGPRTIELRDNTNTTINTVTVNLLTTGANTVILYFPLAVGNNYKLALGAGTANLFRSNYGVNYPYNIAGAVNIVNSSSGAGSYYWFYRWEVQKEDCSSPLVPVTVTLAPPPAVSMSISATNICRDDMVTLTGSPAGGLFTGAGVSGQNFVGSAMAAGVQTISYTYTDPNGCSNSDSKILVTNNCTGIAKNNSAALQVYPNPAKNAIEVKGLPDGSTIMITDVSGKLLVQMKNSQSAEVLDISALANGLYLVKISNGEQLIRCEKLIKE